MAKRRGWGDGSVYPSTDGGGWIASLPVADEGGRRIRRKRRAKTKAEAVALLRKMRADLQTHGDLGNAKRSVTMTIEDYLNVRGAEGLAAKTLEGDVWMTDLIVRGLGRKRTQSLSVDDCDRFLELASLGEFGKPIGRRSLTRVRSTLINAIKNDLRRGQVTRNVAELSVLPQDGGQRVEKRAITHSELSGLLAGASGPTAVLIDLSGRNGLRPAEARALRWSRVDLEAKTLTVDAQINRSQELTPPKTKKAHRTILIDEQTIEGLRSWQTIQGEKRQFAEIGWHDLNLVASTSSGRPVAHRNFHRSLQALCRHVKIEPAISAYELRHTAITLQAEAGHPAWQIADWAGTSERMITDVYRHKLSAVTALVPPRSGRRANSSLNP